MTKLKGGGLLFLLLPLLFAHCPYPVLGTEEYILLLGKKKHRLQALLDTGAKYASIDKALATKLGYTKTHKWVLIQSALGSKKRPLVKIPIIIHGKKKQLLFTLAKRTHLKHKVLIGRLGLKGFLIDPAVKKEPS